VRIVIVPVVERLTVLPPPTGSVRDLIEAFASNFLKEVIGTRRGDLVRLIVAEGHAFRPSPTSTTVRSSRAESLPCSP
jgi:hypothetical protein